MSEKVASKEDDTITIDRARLKNKLVEFFSKYVSHCGYTLQACKGCQEGIAQAIIKYIEGE